jgi:putative effector of murein hydrolase LrgA (UPF0299 family)
MIASLTLLLACQLAGEVLARLLGLPVPGPVLGMALLFLGLQLRSWRRPDAAAIDTLPLGAVAGVLLAHLSLLFVPAGAGIVRHAGTMLAHGPSLIAALVVSTALTLLVTAFVFVRVAALVGSRPDPESGA